ncbi:MAG TPA: hypothetical protein VKF37_20615 [Chloroflexota bacterium]|nr:hypothetical protein [Chloroflexota bacterium]
MKPIKKRYQIVSAGPTTYIATPSGVLLKGQFGSKSQAEAYRSSCNLDAVVQDWCDELARELESVDTKEHALHDLCDRLRALRATLGTALALAEDVRQMEGLEEAARTELHDAVATAYQTVTEYALNVLVRLDVDYRFEIKPA